MSITQGPVGRTGGALTRFAIRNPLETAAIVVGGVAAAKGIKAKKAMPPKYVKSTSKKGVVTKKRNPAFEKAKAENRHHKQQMQLEKQQQRSKQKISKTHAGAVAAGGGAVLYSENQARQRSEERIRELRNESSVIGNGLEVGYR